MQNLNLILRGVDFGLNDVYITHLVCSDNNPLWKESISHLKDVVDEIIVLDGKHEGESNPEDINSSNIDEIESYIKTIPNARLVKNVFQSKSQFEKINNILPSVKDGSLVLVSLENEFYIPEQITQLRNVVAQNPCIIEFIPSVLNFWKWSNVIKKPSRIWNPQLQRIFRKHFHHYDIDGNLVDINEVPLMSTYDYGQLACSVYDLFLYKYDFIYGEYCNKKVPKYRPTLLHELESTDINYDTLLHFDLAHPVELNKNLSSMDKLNSWKTDPFYVLKDRMPNMWAKEPSLCQDTWIINSRSLNVSCNKKAVHA